MDRLAFMCSIFFALIPFVISQEKVTIDIKEDIPNNGRWSVDCYLGYAITPEDYYCQANGGEIDIPAEDLNEEVGFWTKCGTRCKITYTVQPLDINISFRFYQRNLGAEISYDETTWRITGEKWVDTSRNLTDSGIREVSVTLDHFSAEYYTLLDNIIVNSDTLITTTTTAFTEISSSTQDESTSITDESTPSTVQSTFPTDESTPNTDESTLPTDESTSITEESTPSTVQSTLSTDESTSITDESTPSTVQSTLSTDESTSITDESTPSTVQSTLSTDESTSITDESTPSTVQSTLSTDESTSTTTMSTSKNTDNSYSPTTIHTSTSYVTEYSTSEIPSVASSLPPKPCSGCVTESIVESHSFIASIWSVFLFLVIGILILIFVLVSCIRFVLIRRRRRKEEEDCIYIVPSNNPSIKHSNRIREPYAFLHNYQPSESLQSYSRYSPYTFSPRAIFRESTPYLVFENHPNPHSSHRKFDIEKIG